jgi:hypothetical protein
MIGPALVTRPFEADEAADFFALLGEVFQLDPASVQSHYGHPAIVPDLTRWGLWVDGRLASILAVTELEFGWGAAVGISAVGSAEWARGRGHAGRLLGAALEHCGRPAMLFAHSDRLYSRHGFQTVDWVVKGPLMGGPEARPELGVRPIYDAWAAASPARLRRTDGKWRAWRRMPRSPVEASGGYVCREPIYVREAILPTPGGLWPVKEDSLWIGTESMTRALQPPLKRSWRELLVMTRGFPEPPQMFMTDQF